MSSDNESYKIDLLRREITQVTGNFALCFCTFTSTTIINNYTFEKISLSKLTASSSGSSNSSETSESRSEDHELIKKKARVMLWTRTNSSVSNEFHIGTTFEPGDYTIGVSFDNEIDAKELYSITFELKYKTISNFQISQMLTQLFRALGHSPSQLLQLKYKSEGETVATDRKIRNDLSKIIKTLEQHHTNTQVVPVSQAIQTPQVSLLDQKEIKCSNIPMIEEIKNKLIKIDEKCNETTYLIKENNLTTELVQLKSELIKGNEELMKKLLLIENKLKCFSEDVPVVAVTDVISLTRERNTLLEKLTEAENVIDDLQNRDTHKV